MPGLVPLGTVRTGQFGIGFAYEHYEDETLFLGSAWPGFRRVYGRVNANLDLEFDAVVTFVEDLAFRRERQSARVSR